MNSTTTTKPECKLSGQNGNVFNLIGIASNCLKKAGLETEAKEMSEKCFQSSSYDETIQIIMNYVDVI